MNDCIERKKAIELIQPHVKPQTVYGEGYLQAIKHATDILEIMPAEDVQPVKRGYWKNIMMSEATGWDLSLTGGRDEVLETVCSICGNCCAFDEDGEGYLSPYCPSCGARTDGEYKCK